MKGTISKSVIAIVILGIALTAYLVLHGYGRRQKTTLEEASVAPEASDAGSNVFAARGSSSPALRELF